MPACVCCIISTHVPATLWPLDKLSKAHTTNCVASTAAFCTLSSLEVCSFAAGTCPADASQVEDARQLDADNLDSLVLTEAKEPAPRTTGEASGKADNRAHTILQDGTADVSEAKASLESDGYKTNVAKSSSEAPAEVRAQFEILGVYKLQNLTA